MAGPMSADRYDVVIVGGGSAGCALANRISADPGTSVLVLEAGHSDWRIDPFVHMPAALPIPIGNRLYDWKYRTDPEPHMNGRRVFHARGKVLGGSSSINGMIFQRGNPLDYERWAAQPGMKEWGYAHCLPYFKRMETRLLVDGTVAADEWRGGDGPLVLEQGPATNPLFGAFFEAVAAGRLPPHRRRQRLPPGGLRPLRPQRAPRPPPLGRAGLPAPRAAPQEPDRPHARARHQGPVRGQARRRRRLPPRRPARRSVAAGEVILCGGAINTPQLLQLSGIGDQQHLAEVGVHARAPPARRRREPPGPPRGLHPVRLQAAGLDRAGPAVAQAPRHRLPVAVPPPRARRHQPLRGRRLRPQQRGRRLPQPDVPLPADRDPLRRQRARRGPRLPGAHRAHVRRHPRPHPDRLADPKQHPSMVFNYLSTPTDRREWVEAIRVARDILNQPAFAPYNDGELSPGPVGRDRRGDPRLGARRRRDRAAPLVHRRHGRRRDVGRRPRRRCACTASRACAWSTRRSSPSSPTATSTPP